MTFEYEMPEVFDESDIIDIVVALFKSLGYEHEITTMDNPGVSEVNMKFARIKSEKLYNSDVT